MSAARRRSSYGAFLEQATARPSAMGQIIWPHVSVAEIDDLDARMRHLNTDVLKLEAGPAPEPNTAQWAAWFTHKQAINAWKWDWTSYYVAWGAWRDDHYSEWSRLGEGVRQEYDNWVASYNERLRSFKQDFGKGSTEAKTKTPAGKEAAAGIEAVTDLIKLGIIAYVGISIYREVRK